MSIASQRGVDHRNPVPVNLLGRYLRPIRQPQPLSHFAMCTFQPGKRGGFIAPHIDPGDPLDEDSATTSDGIKRRKTFNNAVCATSWAVCVRRHRMHASHQQRWKVNGSADPARY
jgi:hypothetical protein